MTLTPTLSQREREFELLTLPKSLWSNGLRAVQPAGRSHDEIPFRGGFCREALGRGACLMGKLKRPWL